MNLLIRISALLILALSAEMHAEDGAFPASFSGVIPSLTMTADHHLPSSEAGTGALMPWANRLWVVTYVAHMEGTGSGTGLYEINNDLTLKKHPKSVVGTYANRLVHKESQQLAIGPYLIDTEGNVRLIEAFKKHRLAATMTHLSDPDNKLYYLAMEGEFFEVDVHTLEVKQLFQLMKELNEPPKSKPHFKSGYTIGNRVVIANNSYAQSDFDGEWAAGRLAEWDGKTWTILEETAFTEDLVASQTNRHTRKGLHCRSVSRWIQRALGAHPFAVRFQCHRHVHLPVMPLLCGQLNV